MSDRSGEITHLLSSFGKGEREAWEQLLPLVYKELRRMARARMAGLRGDHTLVPTALVHEAFLYLSQRSDLVIHNRLHFFRVAGQCMRWILMDYAKGKSSAKRGGVKVCISFDENLHGHEKVDLDLSAVNEALEKLGQKNERIAKVVELRFLIGLSFEEIAETLELSVSTVKRDWSFAKAWLNRELRGEKAA